MTMGLEASARKTPSEFLALQPASVNAMVATRANRICLGVMGHRSWGFVGLRLADWFRRLVHLAGGEPGLEGLGVVDAVAVQQRGLAALVRDVVRQDLQLHLGLVGGRRDERAVL